MSNMLSIGASGVRAYQAALGVASDNIANAGTAGYTRRVAVMREVTPAGAQGLTASVALPGQGVIVTSVDRQADAYRAGAVRTASADLARTEAGTAWLTRIEAVLVNGGADRGMTGFFTATQKLAADPTSPAARAAVLAAADGAATAFRTTGAGLQSASVELDAVTGDTVAQVNALAAGLAKVNEGLGRTAPGTSGAANLLDQRDRMLEQLSGLTDIAVRLDDAGRATVRLDGANGPALVSGRDTAALTVNRNDEGGLAFVMKGADGERAVTPVAGALAGYAEAAQRLAGARDRLDTIAGDFAGAVNAQFEAGDDLAGAPGEAMFAIGDPASRLTVQTDNPSRIAAAVRGGGPRDGSNLAALQARRTATGMEDAATALTAGLAATIEARGLIAEAQGTIRDAAVSARDAVGGVDLDREAVDLIRFQQAYQASSRVIQVARDTLQTILDIR